MYWALAIASGIGIGAAAWYLRPEPGPRIDTATDPGVRAYDDLTPVTRTTAKKRVQDLQRAGLEIRLVHDYEILE